mmetsp:Transcript_27483/g.26561  ORF Transcript_27483/g.26561 Transcript_27483/m.26561 type:complete len:309 (-) Transcript_27483:183-1109(-)
MIQLFKLIQINSIVFGILLDSTKIFYLESQLLVLWSWLGGFAVEHLEERAVHLRDLEERFHLESVLTGDCLQLPLLHLIRIYRLKIKGLLNLFLLILGDCQWVELHRHIILLVLLHVLQKLNGAIDVACSALNVVHVASGSLLEAIQEVSLASIELVELVELVDLGQIVLEAFSALNGVTEVIGCAHPLSAVERLTQVQILAFVQLVLRERPRNLQLASLGCVEVSLLLVFVHFLRNQPVLGHKLGDSHSHAAGRVGCVESLDLWSHYLRLNFTVIFFLYDRLWLLNLLRHCPLHSLFCLKCVMELLP